jgi:hypothetical protein
MGNIAEGPYVQYGPGECGATFVRRCSKCFRFVKADDSIKYSEDNGLNPEPNATCKKCGRTTMDFVGFL